MVVLSLPVPVKAGSPLEGLEMGRVKRIHREAKAVMDALTAMKCHKCGKEFYGKSNFADHMSTQHPVFSTTTGIW